MVLRGAARGCTVCRWNYLRPQLGKTGGCLTARGEQVCGDAVRTGPSGDSPQHRAADRRRSLRLLSSTSWHVRVQHADDTHLAWHCKDGGGSDLRTEFGINARGEDPPEARQRRGARPIPGCPSRPQHSWGLSHMQLGLMHTCMCTCMSTFELQACWST